MPTPTDTPSATPLPADRSPAPANDGAGRPAAEDRVSIKEKIAYAAGGIAGSLQNNVDNSLNTPVFVREFGISPAVLSGFEVLYRMWDAVTDMLMGWTSDRTRSRWGRRRPYLFVGAILAGLWMPVIWLLNREWDTGTIILWMVGCQLGLFLFHTIWNIPYQCLLIEMSPSSVERTNIAAWRGYVGKLSALGLAWVWFLAQSPIFAGPDGKPDVLRGAFWITCGFGVLAIVLGVLPSIFCKERFYRAAAKQKSAPLIGSVKLTFRNPCFRVLAAVLVLFTLGTMSTGQLGFFVRLYHVAQGDTVFAAKLTALAVNLQMVTGFLGIPVVQWAARRFGKRRALGFVMAYVGLAAISTWFTYTPEHPYLSLFTGVFMAPATSAIWILFPSMTGDIVDDDELRTAERREGAFASIFSWFFKAASSLAMSISGFLVVWVGFDVDLREMQAPDVVHRMRLALVFVPVVFIGLGVLMALRYPLDNRRVEEIRHELEARRGKV
jgi:GPH family glycoside/pentoside/hexuronide:cation symporter